MKNVHYVRFRVLSKPEEDFTIIKKTLLNLIPFDLDEEKVILSEKKVKGFNEREITIFQVEFLKDKHSNAFLKNFVEKLNVDQKKLLISQVESRLDESFHFFIRLDKKKLIDNELFITDSGDCFHLSFCVACFPRSRENAIEKIKEIFK